uniref:Uncharacterized protein n=1 Tax=Amphimedon queenslandica TaxID=400682 RepID=A0A1X7VBM4_AMPQE
MRKLVLETVTTLGATFVIKLVCICSLIETEYEAVEDMEEEKETEDCAEDIDPPLFDPEVAVEQKVSDLKLESVTPDALTTHSCDDIRKEDLQEKNCQSSLNMDVVVQIIAMHCSVTLAQKT